jgi:xanthine phosphoribosyltransferase
MQLKANSGIKGDQLNHVPAGTTMQQLKDRIRRDGLILSGNILKVGSFLNHQMDIALFNEIGKEFFRRFAGVPVTKILTIEASGIGLACITAQYFNVPVVFAKKSKTRNISGGVLTVQVKSFTHDVVYDVVVAREYISKNDTVLIIDDFLANGCALEGLIQIVKSAGAQVAGAGIAIEKGFQDGGGRIRAQGIRLESLAVIERMSPEEGITFRE